jgi:small subunit ribosomal protein S4
LHGHLTVNGRKVTIPSYRVKPGEVVAWRERSIKAGFYENMARGIGQRPVPEWLELNKSTMAATVIRDPEANELEGTIDTRLIVEHYSL